MRNNDIFQTPISERHLGGTPFRNMCLENVVITHVIGHFLERKLKFGRGGKHHNS